MRDEVRARVVVHQYCFAHSSGHDDVCDEVAAPEDVFIEDDWDETVPAIGTLIFEIHPL